MTRLLPLLPTLMLGIVFTTATATATATGSKLFYAATLHIDGEHVHLVVDATTDNHTSTPLSIPLDGNGGHKGARPTNPTTLVVPVFNNRLVVATATRDNMFTAGIPPGVQLAVVPTAVARWAHDIDSYAVPAIASEWAQGYAEDALGLNTTCLVASPAAAPLAAPLCTRVVSTHNTSFVFTTHTVTVMDNPIVHGDNADVVVQYGFTALLLFLAVYFQANNEPTMGIITGLVACVFATTLAWLHKNGFAHAMTEITAMDGALYGTEATMSPPAAIIARGAIVLVIAVLAELTDPTGCLERVKRRMLLFANIQLAAIPFAEVAQGGAQTAFLHVLLFTISMDVIGDSVLASSAATMRICLARNQNRRTPIEVGIHIAIVALIIALYAVYTSTSALAGAHIFMLSQNVPERLATVFNTGIIVLHAAYITGKLTLVWTRLKGNRNKGNSNDVPGGRRVPGASAGGGSSNHPGRSRVQA